MEFMSLLVKSCSLPHCASHCSVQLLPDHPVRTSPLPPICSSAFPQPPLPPLPKSCSLPTMPAVAARSPCISPCHPQPLEACVVPLLFCATAPASAARVPLALFLLCRLLPPPAMPPPLFAPPLPFLLRSVFLLLSVLLLACLAALVARLYLCLPRLCCAAALSLPGWVCCLGEWVVRVRGRGA